LTPNCSDRARRAITACREIEKRRAISACATPSAASKTVLARRTNPAFADVDRLQFLSPAGWESAIDSGEAF